jgi:hypothetical protein
MLDFIASIGDDDRKFYHKHKARIWLMCEEQRGKLRLK